MKLVSLYKKILRIRKIELKISQEYSKGNMRCPVHLSIGQEIVPSILSININHKDFAVSTHRSHAHYLGKDGDLKRMIAEIYGKITVASIRKKTKTIELN